MWCKPQPSYISQHVTCYICTCTCYVMRCRQDNLLWLCQPLLSWSTWPTDSAAQFASGNLSVRSECDHTHLSAAASSNERVSFPASAAEWTSSPIVGGEWTPGGVERVKGYQHWAYTTYTCMFGRPSNVDPGRDGKKRKRRRKNWERGRKGWRESKREEGKVRGRKGGLGRRRPGGLTVRVDKSLRSSQSKLCRYVPYTRACG